MFGHLNKDTKLISLNSSISKSSINVPVTRRTYSKTISEEKKKALEALHTTREAKQTEQRKLEKLRITTEKENIIVEEKILEATIKRLKKEENNHERLLKNMYNRKN
jgi:hypothetical protein